MQEVEFQKRNSEEVRQSYKDIRRKMEIASRIDGTRVLTEPSDELHKTNTRIFISWKKD